MSIYFQSLIIIVIEIFCYKLFFAIFANPKKYKNKLTSITLFLALIFSSFVSTATISNNFLVLKQLVIILIFTFYMCLLFEATFFKTLTLSIIFQGLSLITDYSFFLFINFLKIDDTPSPNLLNNYELVIVLAKATLLALVLILNQYFDRRKKLNIDVPKRDWALILAFPLMTIGSIAALLISFTDHNSKEQANILFVISSSLVFMNIIEFYLIKNILTREKQIREDELFKLQIANQVQMYHSISTNLDIQKRKTHEHKNQMTCLEGLLYDKKYDEAKAYAKKINIETTNYYDYIDTNNVIVNAILNTKYQEAREADILLIFKLNDLSQMKMADTDIVIILSNLVNNAIEATSKCSSNRIVKIKLEIEATNIIIAVSNFYENELIESGDTFATTKSTDPDNHGMGLGNIIDIVNKYHGSYTIDTQNNEFSFSSIIPNSPCQ